MYSSVGGERITQYNYNCVSHLSNYDLWFTYLTSHSAYIFSLFVMMEAHSDILVYQLAAARINSLCILLLET